MAVQVSGLLSPFLLERRLAAARPHVAEGRVLDYGCGNGELARYVEPSRYLGLDADPASVEAARARHPRHRFVAVSGGEQAAGAGRFDVVVGLAVIEHLADPEAWLRQLRSCLAPGGRIVLTTPHPALRRAHEFGAWLGLFSRDAAEEHNVLIGRRLMRRLASAAGFEIAELRRFLLGCNQLFILRAVDPGPGAPPTRTGHRSPMSRARSRPRGSLRT